MHIFATLLTALKKALRTLSVSHPILVRLKLCEQLFHLKDPLDTPDFYLKLSKQTLVKISAFFFVYALNFQ